VDGLWSEHERRRVTRLCAVLTGDHAAADDLAQETLLEAWRIRHRLVDPAGASAWLDAVARNVCHRWRVQRARRSAHELTSERPAGLVAMTPDTCDELAEVLEREELVELLERALGLLTPESREALVARYVEELMPGQIARRLAVSPEAVTMRLVRGRARLREVLETELADEPLARAWIDRHGTAWRPTRLVCPGCGHTATSIRRDPRAGVVELRCERCDPAGVASSWRLDNPALAGRLAGVQRPSTVVGRMAAWAHGWWPGAIGAGHAPCTRCGRDVPLAAYIREEPLEPRSRRGWHATCTACGEELSTSLLGYALACPETRELRRRRPRAHAVPTRRVTYGGSPALLVGVRDDSSGDGVDVVFDDRTTLPLAVVRTS
jgi:RNA polymerase sigma factor (sigma-70 family)